jgi:hypothetical protein
VIFSGASGRSDGVGLRAGDLSGRRKAAKQRAITIGSLNTANGPIGHSRE